MATNRYSKMRTTRSSIVLTAVGACWLISGACARAECSSPILYAMTWCNDCRTDGTLAVNRDQPCERPFRPRATDNVELIGVRVSERSKHGVAGSNGTMIAYSPSKGFVGRDDFVIEIRYR
jgi:hypothetical protein